MASARTRLYRIAWNWHFWSGLLITPVFVVACVTGALYVFKPEIERWVDREIMQLTPGPEARPIAGPIGTFERSVDADYSGYALRFVNFDGDPTHAWEGILQDREGADEHDETGPLPTLHAYFDPYAGRVLGVRDRHEGFFAEVLAIHRNLWIGTPGRVMVELATCWGIVSTLLGLYLWWPRKRERFWGVWLPRLRGRTRVVLRDWHTVPAFYTAPLAVLVLFTGLLFSPVWGIGYQAANAVTGGFPDFFLSPPTSVEPPTIEHPRLDPDRALDIASALYPFAGKRFSMEIPRRESDGAFAFIDAPISPFDAMVAIHLDAVSGRVLAHDRAADIPIRTRITLLFYPIHVGSIFGWPTQVLAMLTCLVLTAAAVTGVWLWWIRRPVGAFGAPRPTPAGDAPAWLFWLTVAFGLFFPVVGLSLLAITIGDAIHQRWQQRPRRPPESPAA